MDVLTCLMIQCQKESPDEDNLVERHWGEPTPFDFEQRIMLIYLPRWVALTLR